MPRRARGRDARCTSAAGWRPPSSSSAGAASSATRRRSTRSWTSSTCRARPEQPEEQEDEVELSDREVVVGYYDGERLDLGDVVREQLFLSLPLKRLCREDCRGLCPTCGKNLNTGACGCPPPEEPEDPRLSPLRGLIDKK